MGPDLFFAIMTMLTGIIGLPVSTARDRYPDCTWLSCADDFLFDGWLLFFLLFLLSLTLQDRQHIPTPFGW